MMNTDSSLCMMTSLSAHSTPPEFYKRPHQAPRFGWTRRPPGKGCAVIQVTLQVYGELALGLRPLRLSRMGWKDESHPIGLGAWLSRRGTSAGTHRSHRGVAGYAWERKAMAVISCRNGKHFGCNAIPPPRSVRDKSPRNAGALPSEI